MTTTTRSPLRQVLATPTRPEGRALAGAALLGVLGIGAELAAPWPLAVAVDALTATGDSTLPLLVACASGTVAVTLVAGALDAAAARLTERSAERVATRLRGEVFSAAVRRPLTWHDRTRSGEVVARLTSDTGRVTEAVVAVGTDLLPSAVTVVVAIALLWAIQPLLALVALAAVPLLALVAVRQRRAVHATQRTARTESGHLTGTASDLLRHVRAVQAFGREDRVAASFAGRNHDLHRARVDAVHIETQWLPRAGYVVGVGTGIVLLVGGLAVRNGTMTVGGLVVAMSYLRSLYGPLRSLTRLSTTLAKAAASATRLADVLEPAAPTRPGRPVPQRIGRMELRGVDFSYGDRPVLRGLDLRVGAGETVCLWGPSGAGKTTVLHLLLGLYAVDSGQVLLDGVPLDAYDLTAVRRRIAFVPQDPWLLDASIAENIAFGADDATRAQVLAAGRTARVDDFALALPDGYDTVLGEDGHRLSGGQRRRVAIARAAVSDASVLLLDEPTASLDGRTATAVVEAVRAAGRGRTTLLVTHDPALAALCDRVVPFGSAAAPTVADLVPTAVIPVTAGTPTLEGR